MSPALTRLTRCHACAELPWRGPHPPGRGVLTMRDARMTLVWGVGQAAWPVTSYWSPLTQTLLGVTPSSLPPISSSSHVRGASSLRCISARGERPSLQMRRARKCFPVGRWAQRSERQRREARTDQAGGVLWGGGPAPAGAPSLLPAWVSLAAPGTRRDLAWSSCVTLGPGLVATHRV